MVPWALLAGSAPTEGVAPGPEVLLDEVGLSEEKPEAGWCREVTPVLSVSCSGRMGPVSVVLPGRSAWVSVFEVLGSVLESVRPCVAFAEFASVESAFQVSFHMT